MNNQSNQSIQYKDDELCVNGACRYLAKNGPIGFLPNLRFNLKEMVLWTICCICVILLILIFSSIAIKMNKGTIRSIMKGSSNVYPSVGYGDIGYGDFNKVDVVDF